MAPSNDIEIGTDEQKTFEVIQEGEQKEFEHHQTPHIVRRGLTEVSAMFDRNGKGYLDDTERALRRMDSKNTGHLGIDKVCIIFESLQAEQERSAELLEALRLESKKAMSLKRGVIALTFFAVLLAVANIGTSFAVSKLVKETRVSANGDLVAKDTGARLGTTNKLMIIDMESIEDVEADTRHRALQANNICTEWNAASATADFQCRVTGVMNRNKALNIHDALTVEGVTEILLNCNSKKSSIMGGMFAPPGEPGLFLMGQTQYYIFPDAANTDHKYEAVQVISNSTKTCDAHFKLAMYCPPTSLTECWVMTAYDQSVVDTCGSPEVCGPKPTARTANEPLAQPLSASAGRGGAGGGAAQP